MIDLNICAKCANCKETYPSKIDKDGKVIVLPSVDCEISGPLLGSFEVPEGCPYILEHLLLDDRDFVDDLME